MNSKVQKIIIGISLVIGIVCLGYIVSYFTSIEKNADIYEELQEEVSIKEEKPIEEEPIEEEPTEEMEIVEEEPIEIPVDFASLKEINPDVYAWIEIPDTQIAYPILQNEEDDLYYLNRTIDGVEGLPGSIYTEFGNGNDFAAFNTIIYGHNMKNDSMFGGLNLYRDPEYMKEHEFIYIYTEDTKLTYQVVVATTFDDRHLLRGYLYEEESERQRFLDETSSVKDMNKVVREGIQISPDDRIITLSTCIANQADNRLLVEAILIEEER